VKTRLAGPSPTSPMKAEITISPISNIMVNMSHHARDENLRLTASLAAYRHDRGIAVEASPGRIEGGEDGVRDTVDLDAVRTSPDEARAFAATGHRLARSGFR